MAQAIVEPAGGVADATPPASPLQLGQTVYEVSEAAILVTPKGATGSQLSRVTFAPPAEGPGVELGSAEAASLPALSQFLDMRAVADPETQRQVLLALRTDAATPFAIERTSATPDGTTTHETLAIAASGIEAIVDVLPAPPGAVADDGAASPPGPLLLAGAGGGGVSLQACDAGTGALGASWAVPLAGASSVLAGRLVRHGTDAWVALLVASGGDLVACALPASALADATIPATAVTTVSLGSLATAPRVAVTVARCVSGSSDQQLAVLYDDDGGTAQLALVGLGSTGALAKLAAAPLSTSLGTPEQPIYALAAADVDGDGVEEVVAGYPVTYGGVAGAAALVLHSYDAHAQALDATSTYAVASPSGQPLASYDLHLAAGMFGTTGAGATLVAGVLVLGCAASFGDLLEGQGEVIAGVVAVEPDTHRFPPLGSTPSALPFATSLATVDPGERSFMGTAVDLRGLSVVLGNPTFEQVIGEGQILAILCAPPYDGANARSLPTLTFSRSGTTVQGYNVSSNKMWTTSTDVGINIGVAGQAIGSNVNHTYGRNFDKTTDSTTTSGVQVTTTISQVDMLLVYAMTYWVWKYPVYRPSMTSEQSGTLLVVYPASPQPTQSLVPAYELDYGYRQQFENGQLLSYVGAPLDGYSSTDPKCSLFESIGLAVTQDSGGSTVTYDKSTMNSDTVNVGYNVHNSASDSAHIAAATDLFDYLPVSFGLNVSGSESYSDTEMTTTSLSRTETLTITITSGSVTDPAYDFELTPYVYQHETLGCLVVGYDVSLTGAGWQDAYPTPYPMLVRPYRGSSDTLLSGLSRSIRFPADASGAVSIAVDVLNRGYKLVDAVTCTAYLGLPTVSSSGGQPVLVPPDASKQIGQATASRLGPLARTTVTIPWAAAAADEAVTVMVSGGARPPIPALAEVAWNTYPESYAAQLPL